MHKHSNVTSVHRNENHIEQTLNFTVLCFYFVINTVHCIISFVLIVTLKHKPLSLDQVIQSMFMLYIMFVEFYHRPLFLHPSGVFLCMQLILLIIWRFASEPTELFPNTFCFHQMWFCNVLKVQNPDCLELPCFLCSACPHTFISYCRLLHNTVQDHTTVLPVCIKCISNIHTQKYILIKRFLY